MTQPAQPFRSQIPVRFTHCDAAGIVFYPRYFEMFNDLVEEWCGQGLGFSFAEMHNHRGWGIPTAHLEVDFLAPSTFGDVLSATLSVCNLGTTSITLNIVLRGPEGEDRVRGKVVLVLYDRATKRATPIPEELRGRLSAFQADAPLKGEQAR